MNVSNRPQHCHHHHVALVARISLTLSRHSSLSFIALGRSSGQHPVSSHSCWMYVRAGRPAFSRPCVGVHKNTSLMSSSLLLQQCHACQHCTFILYTMYTSSFTTITYKSYNVNTTQISIKNNHHNPPTITHTTQTHHLFPQFHNDNTALQL